MPFENMWSMWPFRGYFGTRSIRRYAKQSSARCSSTHRVQSEPLIHILGPWESKMVALQSILIWEKPGKSILAIFTANILFWFLALSEARFFFAISILGLAAFLHHEWVYSIWPEIRVPKPQADREEWTPVHPSVLSAPEVSRYLEDTWKYIQEQQIRLAQLRKKQPGWFCFLIVTLFSFLWLLGRFVPGLVLLYATLMTFMCGPAVALHLIPKSTFRRLQHWRSILLGRKTSGTGGPLSPESDLTEFLPEESEEVQDALGIPLSSPEFDSRDDAHRVEPRRRGRRSTRGGGKMASPRSGSREVGSSFLAGLCESDFPTMDDNFDSLIDESDLIRDINMEGVVPSHCTARGLPTDDDMNFVSTHFGDSSDEEDDFSSGLVFRRTTPPPPTILGETGGYGPALLPASVAPNSANAAMTTLIGNLVSSEMFLSSIGQHLVSALGGREAATTSLVDSPRQEEGSLLCLASSAVQEEKVEDENDVESTGKDVTSSDTSSLDEEFELISDNELY